MRSDETLIAMAHRHVREAEEHIQKQHEIIERLHADALPTELAEGLLEELVQTLDDHRRSVARIEEEQRSGLRDAAGAIVIGAKDRDRPRGSEHD